MGLKRGTDAYGRNSSVRRIFVQIRMLLVDMLGLDSKSPQYCLHCQTGV